MLKKNLNIFFLEYSMFQSTKKNRILVLLLYYFFINTVYSQTIQIGSNTPCVPSTNLSCTQFLIPIFTNHNYSYSQQIIHKEQILEYGWTNNMEYISRIRYYINNSNFNNLVNSDVLSIYIGSTQKDKFDSINDWIPISSMNLVFDGLINHPLGESWWEIVFQTPFYFDGSDNLVIAIHEKKWYYTPAHTYYFSKTDTCNTGIYTTASGPPTNTLNPLNPPIGSLVSQVPIVQFYFEETCKLPTLFRINSINHSTASISWVPVGTELTWKIRYKNENNTTWKEISNISSPSYLLSDLFSLEKYTVQLQANCNSENSEWTNPIFFQTPVDSSYEYTVDWEIYKNVTELNYSLIDSILPDLVIKMDSISSPNYKSKMDKYLSRILGYVVPRKTGLYQFYFGSDDFGELWLSSDEMENNAILAISIDSTTTDWTFNQFTQYLIEGEKYFFKILHYDSVYNDMIKLGWIIPGDSIIRTIKKPFITTSGNNISSQGLYFYNNKIIGYQGYQQKIEYKTIPWNVSDKRVIWSSSDTSIAKVNNNGLVTLSGAGSCIIYGRMYDNNSIFDSLLVEVWTYKGPFYVKPNAPTDGSGLDWDNPIDLQTILNISKNRFLNDTIIILVSEGIYKPTSTIDRNISIHLQNVELYGGYNILSTGTDTTMRNSELFETTFNGNIGDQQYSYDNCYHVVVATKYVLIDGITISEGAARSSDNRPYTTTYTYIDDDNGGGLKIPAIKSNVIVNNCIIKNNNAYNGGGGVYIRLISNNLTNSSTLTIKNSKIHNNRIDAPSTPIGGGFNLVVNAYGAGIVSTISKLNLLNTIFFNNYCLGAGKAIYVYNSDVDVQNCSFYNNTTSNGSTIEARSGSGKMTINNSTIYGGLGFYYARGGLISNSTIIGSGFLNLEHPDSKVIIDNSIWSNINLQQYPLNLYDTSKVQFKNSIVRNVLYGQNFQDSLFMNLPSSDLWLDTLANNGGNTPTMKLKNVQFNPAKSNGNPFYLGTHDQRGAIRQDSVSIGAYQWVNPTEIIGSQSVLELCIGDSFELDAEVLPEFVSVADYYLTSSDSSIVSINGKIISALQEGFTTIIYNTSNGQKTDTCYLEVIGNVGTGTILGDVSVCQGQNSSTYIVPTINNATSYIWTLPNGATGTSTTNSIDVDFSTSAISGYITVKGINNCGEGDVSTLSITVNPLPGESETISGDAIVCLGQNSVIYTVPTIANATSYIWTLPNGATGSSITNSIDVNFGTTAISGNITVKGTNNCGDGDVSILVISEDPLPVSAGTITGDLIVCQGENTVTYSVPPIENAIYYDWTLPNGATGTSSTNSIDVDFGITAISGNITVKGRNQCGDGTGSTLSIVVNPLPANAETISGISNVCQGENSVSYSVAPIENAISYIWTLPNGVTGSSTTNTINVSYSTIANSGNISVKGINECGVGTTSTKIISVNPLPNAGETIIGPASVCQGQNSVVYYVPTIANADSYVWTFPNGATGSSTTNTITVDYSTTATSGNITVKGINECGEGLVSTLPVILNLISDSAGTISGISSVCQGQNSVTYTVPSIENALNYYWTLPNGATGSSLTNSIIVNFGTSAVSGNITVVGVNYCGNGPVSSKIISVNPLPSAPEPIVGFETVCQGQNSVNYSIPLIPNAISYIWSLPSGVTGTSSTNSINVNFGINSSSGIITVKGTNGCGIGNTATKAITINSLPGIASTISGANTVCVGENAVYYSVSEISNATSYIWTLPSGAIGSSSTNSIFVDFGTSAFSDNISVKGINSCGNGSIGSKAITVYPIPAAAGIISGSTSVCYGESGVTYSTPSIVNATSYIWDYPIGAMGTSSINSITLYFGSSAVSGNITVKGTNFCGEGASSTLPIEINPVPVTPTISLNGTILSSNAITGNQWYNQNGIIEGAINQNYIAIENGVHYVIVTLFGCSSNPSNSINVVSTEIENFVENRIIKVYPNPVSNELTIENQTFESYQYSMYNGVGQLLFSGTLETEVQLNTSELAKGLYVIKFVNKLGYAYYKVIKQ